MSMVMSAVTCGMEALPVFVECVIRKGPPGLSLTGCASGVDLDLVRASIELSGYSIPNSRVCVQTVPDLSGDKSGLPLAIAMAILAESHQIPPVPHDLLVMGGLDLYGRVVGAGGSVAADVMAQCEGRKVLRVDSLGKLRHADGYDSLAHVPIPSVPEGVLPAGDFGDMYGYEYLKRAITIAVAGRHNLLVVEPASSEGVAAACASLVPTILPPLTEEQRRALAVAYDLAGIPFDGARPVRMPHFSATRGAVLGGGRPVRPGEATLASGGVLFLGDLQEFGSSILQTLRQPVEERQVTIVRCDGAYRMPADFLLMASAKPCACGQFGEGNCTCSPQHLTAYQARLGGPISDKFELCAEVARPRIVSKQIGSMTSGRMADVVLCARDYRSWRESKGIDGGTTPEGESTLDTLCEQYPTSRSTEMCVVSVARTIADMDECEAIGPEHIREAWMYRSKYGRHARSIHANRI